MNDQHVSDLCTRTSARQRGPPAFTNPVGQRGLGRPKLNPGQPLSIFPQIGDASSSW